MALWGSVSYAEVETQTASCRLFGLMLGCFHTTINQISWLHFVHDCQLKRRTLNKIHNLYDGPMDRKLEKYKTETKRQVSAHSYDAVMLILSDWFLRLWQVPLC